MSSPSFPLYLDVPMMVSTLAHLEDGLSTSPALEALGIDLEGRVGVSADRTAANAITQRHTVASLFGRLLAKLGDGVRPVSNADSLAGLQDGDFVTLVGTVKRNPIFEFIKVMERLFAVAQVDAASVSPALDDGIPEETRQVFTALRAEFDASPVVDATLDTDGGLSGVLAFRKAYLQHVSLDDLRFGRVRVLGKAVGTLKADATYNVLSRSFVGHMVSAAFGEAVGGLQQINPTGTFEMTATVTGPGLFVVPLAVYI